MTTKLNAIADRAALNLKDLIRESEEKLLEAWNAVAQEAQDNETKPVFNIGLAIKLDIDEDKMETTLSFSIKRKLSVSSAIPDPSQPDLLSREDTTMTLKTNGGEPVTMTGKQFDNAVNKLNRLAKSKK